MAYRRRYRMTVPRRTYRRYSRFNRATRSFYRNLTSTLQQRDAVRFTIKTRADLSLVLNQGEVYGTAGIPIWKLMQGDPQFGAMKTLFDQVKINGVRLTLRPVLSVTVNSTVYPAIVYAWDRNGSDMDNLASVEDKYKSICTYGSSRVQALTFGVSNLIRTHVVAQDLQERALYIGTDDIGAVHDISKLEESFFKPTFLVGVQYPGGATAGVTYRWEVEAAIDCTFRGTRYSK